MPKRGGGRGTLLTNLEDDTADHDLGALFRVTAGLEADARLRTSNGLDDERDQVAEDEGDGEGLWGERGVLRAEAVDDHAEDEEKARSEEGRCDDGAADPDSEGVRS